MRQIHQGAAYSLHGALDRRKARTPGRKYGFTLVELLVVIAIIGGLVALLLPAVQAALARRLGAPPA